MKILQFLSTSLALVSVQAQYESDLYMHPTGRNQKHDNLFQQPAYEDTDYWIQNAQDEIAKRAAMRPIEAVAKNIIFYLGDGMSVQTITAARIFKGQKVDNLPFGEEAILHMDTFPITGTSKTFCTDAQVADSACTATAYLCGSKANVWTAGVSSDVRINDCAAQADETNQLSSVLAWAQAAGKSTGIVTTTRVTHASPSAAYAHTANRDWENDAMVSFSGGDPSLCPDIAQQLILNQPGSGINVILGGGRRQFLPNTTSDPEYPSLPGYRTDTRDLISIWREQKEQEGVSSGKTYSYITGKDELLGLNSAETDYLLGLFEPSHVSYFDQQEQNNDPSLTEMTEAAINILKKNPKGFFLFVEGGRIDHAHHDNLIARSLWETVEFDRAIQKGDEMTSDEDTLLVVTSDHSHVMHFAGYPGRGTPILKYGPELALDGLPYATLGYGNGPGQLWINATTGQRHNITDDDPDDPNYQTPVPVPLDSETHGGDDVLIMAKGPHAHFLTGVHQQSYIPHVIGYAACIGNGAVSEHCKSVDNNGAGNGEVEKRILILALMVLYSLKH